MRKKPPLNRSETMSRIRAKDTKPELVIRRDLHSRGFRFRLHKRDLPGRPDIVLTRFQAVIEVRGCFWHGHPGCGRVPKTNQSFWLPKIAETRVRDERNQRALLSMGWRVLVVWECAITGPRRRTQGDLIDKVEIWIHSGEAFREIQGHAAP